jgi:hypothetical protein
MKTPHFRTAIRGKAMERWMRGLLRALVLLTVSGMLCSCFLPQVSHTSEKRLISLKAGDLEKRGIAFLTPSTVTGQEEEKQALAIIFVDVMKQVRPGVRCVGLPETLNALSRAGLVGEYKAMLDDYRDTGIFNQAVLERMGKTIGVGYVAQLKLMTFTQGSAERFGIFGMRLIVTNSAHVRIFFQIWDTDGEGIVWEGIQEMHYAVDRVTEDAVTLKTTIDKAAQDIVAQLP